MTTRNYGALRDSESAIALIEKLIRDNRPFAFDIEAGYSGPDQEKVSLKQFHPSYFVVGISLTNDETFARYIPFAHDAGGNVDDLVGVARALWRLLSTGLGIAHNAAYELKGMSRFFRETLWNDPVVGEEVRRTNGLFPITADTMLMVWMAAEFHPIRVGKDLKSVADAAFGIKMTHFDQLFPAVESDLGPAIKASKKRFNRFNTRNAYSPKIIEYACEDSVASYLIYLRYQDRFATGQPEHMLYTAETRLIPVLCEMEMGPVDENGVAQGNMLFNWTTIQRKSDEVTRFAKNYAEDILVELSERLGRTININLGSVKQLQRVLFDAKPEGLGLPVKLRSEKTGDPSTSDAALGAIAKSDPVIRMILEYRQIMKLNDAYLLKFLKELNYSGTGVVFPNHNQFGALTGRMSVDQVSYQQWPKYYHFSRANGDTLDVNFRDFFIAPEEFRIVGFDYANVEMRIAGAMSGEKKIIDAFNNGMDLHKSTAAATFRVPFDQVTKKQRGRAKTLNFAILYGSGAANIAEMLTSPEDPVTKQDAQKMLDDYLKGYPSLASWIARQKASGSEEKLVHTWFQRQFTLWDYYETEEWKRSKGDRMTINAPVQGTGADILKIAMVRAQKKIREHGLMDKIRMTLSIHDALEFLVHESVSTQEVIDLLGPQVTFPITGFPVSIRADWHEGFQWGSVAEIKLDANQQIVGYEMEYELPWTKESFTWEGATLSEVLDPYYAWEYQTFGVSAPYYAKRNPSFELPDRVESKKILLPPPEEDPTWFHSAEWHEANDQPQTATVTVLEMPMEDQWVRFIEYLKTNCFGYDKLMFETPEGVITLDETYHLTPDDQPQISMILGGASLSFSSFEVDADLLMEGLDV